MKKTQAIFAGVAVVLCFLYILHAQEAAVPVQWPPAPVDSVVGLTADSLGLTRMSPGDLPENASGTFWLVSSNGLLCPNPCLPANAADLPIYGITDGIFLVDSTGGQVATDDQQTVEDALAGLAESVGNLITWIQAAQVTRSLARAMGMEDELDSPSGFSPMLVSYDTNALYLVITNVADGRVDLELRNGTNFVYAIESKTSLSETNWTVECEVFPANAAVLPFTVATQGRQNLLLRAEDLSDVDSDEDGAPDFWAWEYWGNVNVTDTNLDYSGSGNTFAQDYSNNIPPTVFKFTGIEVTNNYVNNLTVPVHLDVAGTPYYITTLIDDGNFSNAVWNTYSGSTVTVNLGLTEGWHEIWIGLRGHADAAASAVWQWKRLKLDTIPPVVIITNPVAGTVSQPLIQVQGLVNEQLARLKFDVSNATGFWPDQTGYATGVFYDTNTLAFTTNSFQGYDVPLTNGVNTISIHATDLAGNVTTTNLVVTLDYAGDTTPPALQLVWPNNGTLISGSHFTLQAQVDDNTASVTATIAGGGGDTNTVQGLVQRDGTVWAQNLPLASGTNLVAVTARDAAGNSSTTNFNVVRSAVSVTVNPISSDQLNQFYVLVTGTVSDTNSRVRVNGELATVTSDGNWSVNTFVSYAGAASLDVEVYDGAGNNIGSQPANQLQPATVDTVAYESYSGMEPYVDIGGSCGVPSWDLTTVSWNWEQGGVYIRDQNAHDDDCEAYPYYNSEALTPDDDYWSWEYAETRDPGGWQFGIPLWRFNHTRTQVALNAELGQIGTSQIYLVRAMAVEPDEYDSHAPRQPLPPEWLQIQGETLINSGLTNEANGAVWGETVVSVPAGGSLDVSPTATQVYNHWWNFYFDVQATKVTLTIKDASGTDLTTQTNTVIVGQPMNLHCQLSLTNGTLTNFPLANFSWSVPGNTFSDYVATASSAVLYTNFSTTQSNVVFYWVDGGLKPVQISATVNGQPVTGTAWFNVIRPEVTWTLTPKDAVAVDTNYALIPGYAGYYYLHAGKNFSTNDAGMYFSFQVTDLKGYTNDYDIQFYQVATIDWKRNIEGGGISGSASVNGKGYDKTFPIPWIGYWKISGYSDDSPAAALTEGDSFYWRSDSFEDYLMFTPEGGKPVPLKSATWNWYGRAQRDTTNSPPVFHGVTPFTNPQAATGADCFSHPTWTNNIENIKPNWQYHATEYPTP